MTEAENLPTFVADPWERARAAVEESAAGDKDPFESPSLVSALTVVVDQLAQLIGRWAMTAALSSGSESVMRAAVGYCYARGRQFKTGGWWLELADVLLRALLPQKTVPDATKLTVFFRKRRVEFEALLSYRNLAAHGLVGPSETENAYGLARLLLSELPMPQASELDDHRSRSPKAWLSTDDRDDLTFPPVARKRTEWRETFRDWWTRHEEELRGGFDFEAEYEVLRRAARQAGESVRISIPSGVDVVLVSGSRQTGRSTVVAELPESICESDRPTIRFRCSKVGPAARPEPFLRWFLPQLAPRDDKPIPRKTSLTGLLAILEERAANQQSWPLLAVDDAHLALGPDGPAPSEMGHVLSEIVRLSGGRGRPTVVLTAIPGFALELPHWAYYLDPRGARWYGPSVGRYRSAGRSDPEVQANPLATSVIDSLTSSAVPMTCIELSAKLGESSYRVWHNLVRALAGWVEVFPDTTGVTRFALFHGGDSNAERR